MKVSTRQITETVAPAVEPVTLTEMKVHCRVDDTNDHDTILGVMTTAVREWLEKSLQISLVQRTYRADIWGLFSVIELPLPPLSSITNIKYYNTDSPQVLTTLDADVYRHDLGYGRIYWNESPTIPSVSIRHDAVQITFVAGYEPSSDSPQDLAGNVPEALKSAIKLQTADLFENRATNEPVGVFVSIQELPTTKMLLAPYREY